MSARPYLQLRGVRVAVAEWYNHLVVAIIVVSRELGHKLGINRPRALDGSRMEAGLRRDGARRRRAAAGAGPSADGARVGRGVVAQVDIESKR